MKESPPFSNAVDHLFQAPWNSCSPFSGHPSPTSLSESGGSDWLSRLKKTGWDQEKDDCRPREVKKVTSFCGSVPRATVMLLSTRT